MQQLFSTSVEIDATADRVEAAFPSLEALHEYIAHINKLEFLKQEDTWLYYTEHTKSIFGQQQQLPLRTKKDHQGYLWYTEVEHYIFKHTVGFKIAATEQQGYTNIALTFYTRRKSLFAGMLFRFFFTLFGARYTRALHQAKQVIEERK